MISDVTIKIIKLTLYVLLKLLIDSIIKDTESHSIAQLKTRRSIKDSNILKLKDLKKNTVQVYLHEWKNKMVNLFLKMNASQCNLIHNKNSFCILISAPLSSELIIILIYKL